MNFLIRVPLNTSPEQHARLCELRAVFARVCNELAPQVQQSRVWNRVALHHLHYRSLRAQFPELGSQMVCNAIYAVSKMSRLIYQAAASPYNVSRMPGKPLPLLKFADSCPVYFDRHTLSIKPGQLSLFTMDGRMRFELQLDADKLALFEQAKLREVVLNERLDKTFELSFFLVSADSPDALEGAESDVSNEAMGDAATTPESSIPEYVSLEVAPT
ncbi:hypothetical protein [Limnohabitans sp. Rim8]|jgi:hypothetical protein|uniref:hypothetical protein n=1 Tax=Limnohabitans sp. Rim8 TaxID=1100718 RepID=UPI0025EA7D64|nr:hypothetical protein [Limnohabitans sp. Rim8]